MSFDFSKLTQKPPMPTKVMLTIRIIVGAYLYYLVYDLRESILPPNTKPVVVAAAILFIIGGGIVLFCSIRDFMRGYYVGGALDVSEKNEDSTE